MDRGAWWAPVRGAAKSTTRLSDSTWRLAGGSRARVGRQGSRLLRSRGSPEWPAGPRESQQRAGLLRSLLRDRALFFSLHPHPDSSKRKRKSGEGGREPSRNSYRRACGLRGIGQLRKGSVPLVIGWALAGSREGRGPQEGPITPAGLSLWPPELARSGRSETRHCAAQEVCDWKQLIKLGLSFWSLRREPQLYSGRRPED